MSDENDDFEDDGDQTQPTGQDWKQVRKELKDLRKSNKELAEQAIAYKDLQRKETFREAGIDPTDSKFKYFVKGYDGELTAEALRKEATEAGLLAPVEPQADAGELQAHNRINQAAAGGEVVGGNADAELLRQISDPNLSRADLTALYGRMGILGGGGQ